MTTFGNTATSDRALLKELYSQDRITYSIYTKNKFLAMVPKKEDAGGIYHVNLVVTGAGRSRSATFGRAQASAGLTGEQTTAFHVSLQENHDVANVESKLIAQSKGKGPAAFLEAVQLIADQHMIDFGNDVAASLYRTADGNRGQVSSDTVLSGSVLKFKNPKDVLLFEVGDELDLSTSKTGAVKTYGSANHGLYVMATDKNACTVTIGDAPTKSATAVALNDGTAGIPTIAAGDYIFVRGDQNLKMNGFQDWIPYGGVSHGESFNGVDRSSDQIRLAGNWMDGTAGQSLVATLEDAINQVGEQGGELSDIFASHKQFGLLNKELTGKQQLVVETVNEELGFEGIKVVGSSGPVTVLPDRTCPADTIAGVNMETWQLLSVGKAVHTWEEDGNIWLRSPDASGMEIRFYSFCNLLCKDPRQNINIKVNP